MDQEIRQLNQDAYRAKFYVDEKGIARKDMVEEVERLQAKIGRAKDINLILQKTVRRARKTKSKLSEEVGHQVVCHNLYIIHVACSDISTFTFFVGVGRVSHMNLPHQYNLFLTNFKGNYF